MTDLRDDRHGYQDPSRQRAAVQRVADEEGNRDESDDERQNRRNTSTDQRPFVNDEQYCVNRERTESSKKEFVLHRRVRLAQNVLKFNAAICLFVAILDDNRRV